MKKKIIILGATGFIVKNLIQYFEKKKEFAIYGTYYKTKFIKLNGVTKLTVQEPTCLDFSTKDT